MANIFELATISRRKGIIISRAERIKREGSPWYLYLLPVTAAGVAVTINPSTEFPLSRKYEPLDYVEIVNNGVATPITIVINGPAGDSHYIPAGVIRTISGEGVALWQVQITNNGVGATVLGLIRLNFKKEAMTIDRWAAEH